VRDLALFGAELERERGSSQGAIMGQDDRDIPGGRPANVAVDDCGAGLRASDQRFTREFGCAPYGMIMAGLSADRPGICLVVNDAYCELTGLSRQELSGHDFLGDFHPEEQPALEELVRSFISGATGQFRLEARLVRKDGDISFVRLTGSVIQPPEAERYLADSGAR
jgi:PAS domain S-box-containing protein